MTVQFDAGAFNATIDKINSGLGTANGHLGALPGAAQQLLAQANVPPNVKQVVSDLVKKVVAAGQALLKKVLEAMEGAVAPLAFGARAFEWLDIRNDLTTVSGALKPGAMLAVEGNWKGSAAGQYVKVRNSQEAAVNKLVALADTLMMRLGLAAGAGLMLYAAIGFALFKFITGLMAAITAMGTLIGAPGGLAYALTQTGISAGEIFGAIAAATAFVGQQAEAVLVLEAQAGDNQFFPGGQWPQSGTSLYSDATVTDGDADWSMVQQPVPAAPAKP